MRIVLPALLGMLALAGCREPQTARAALVCTELCDCLTLSEREECNRECNEDLAPRGISDECFECVTESISCVWTLEVCLEECVDDNGDDEPPIILVDAPFPLDAPF